MNDFKTDYTSRPNKKGIRDKLFPVETTGGTIRKKFAPNGRGLYYLDCSCDFGYRKSNTVFRKSTKSTEDLLIPNDWESVQKGHNNCDSSHQQITGVGLTSKHKEIQTVEENRSEHTNRDVIKADMVCRFQRILANVSDKTLVAATTKRLIKNLPFTPRDRMSNKINQPCEYAIKGKKTAQKNSPVSSQEIVPLPKTIEETYSDVTLACDVMRGNGIPFVVTISQDIHYGTAAVLPSMKLNILESAVTGVMKSYMLQDFTVRQIFVDKQFEGLKNKMNNQVIVNVVSAEEHVPEIEQFIRVIKEHC